MFLDPEAALIPWLRAQLDGARGVTDLPANLQDAVPLFQVAHIGGGDDIPSLAQLTIDIDYFGPAAYPGDRAATSMLARAGHRAIRYQLRGRTLIDPAGAAAVITKVNPSFLPRPDDDYGNPNVFRYLSSYAIWFKMIAGPTVLDGGDPGLPGGVVIDAGNP